MAAAELVAHSGAKKVDLQGVWLAPTPEGTASWQPVAHNLILSLVWDQLKGHGLEVRREQHALARNGARWFCVMDLFRPDTGSLGEYGLVLGLRNSHDRRFAAGLAVGSRVFVCDNQAFSGDVTLARKHTSRVLEDLPRLVAEAFGKLADEWLLQDQRIAAYKRTSFEGRDGERDAHDVLVRAALADVMPAAAIPAVLHQWRELVADKEAGPTAWRLFNAVTGLLGGRGRARVEALPSLIRRTTRLHGLLDGYCGVERTSVAPDLVPA